MDPNDKGKVDDQVTLPLEQAADADQAASAAAVTPEQITELKGELEKTRALLLDPSYIDYLSKKIGSNVSKAAASAAKEAKEDKTDLNAFTNEELVTYIMSHVDGKVAAKGGEMDMTLAKRDADEQVAKAAVKFADFWDYKKEMLQLAADIPALTAERAYLIAKAETGPKEKKAAAVKTEAPVTPGRGVVSRPAKGFGNAFDKAWKDSFGNKEVAS